MMLAIPGVLTPAAAAAMRAAILDADWIDGNVTSGRQSALAKRNRQLPEDSRAAREMGSVVLDALGRSLLFVAAALPLKVFPPLFNRYGGGEQFGDHIDNAVRFRTGTDFRLRSDLSATLFLSDPESYGGGELVAESEPPVKLPAGDMLLYPATTVHRVTPVTRGERIASFFWIQSMVRDDGARAMLFDLDRSVQELSGGTDMQSPALIRLAGVYHNLLRRWAEI